MKTQTVMAVLALLVLVVACGGPAPDEQVPDQQPTVDDGANDGGATAPTDNAADAVEIEDIEGELDDLESLEDEFDMSELDNLEGDLDQI